MANSRVGRESELDLVLTNAIILDPVLGVIKGNIGIKEGRVVGIGRAGNPDISENIDLLIGTSTAVFPCDGMVPPPRGIHTHVPLLAPPRVAAPPPPPLPPLPPLDTAPTLTPRLNSPS